MSARDAWPELPYAPWVDTLDTLHMVFQIMGKVRVALSPKEPEWAHITLYVSPRGITTGPVPSPAGLLEVEADFVEHQLVITTSAGDTTTVALRPRPIAEFWTEFVAALRSVGVDTELSTMPQEVEDPIPFPDDTTHHTYDPEAVQRFWRVLAVMEPVFEEYRAAYKGKVSRVQFFWGSVDLAVTRFSGQPCTPPPGANLLDARDLRLRADEHRVLARQRQLPRSGVLHVRVPEAGRHRGRSAGFDRRGVEPGPR